ncbi:MAG: ribonuclease Y [Chloroflexi bacterium]|nr:ribonuclease Y [Chloroflexota bacterium]
MEIAQLIVENLLIIAVAFGLGYLFWQYRASEQIKTARKDAKRLLEEAETKQRELLLEGKDEVIKLRAAVEAENRERRNELQRQERRLQQKEENLDRKIEGIERRERTLTNREKELDQARQELDTLRKQQLKELERISGLTTSEAKDLLLQAIEAEVRQDASRKIREIELEAKEEGDRRAREIIAAAVQRYAADQVAETTVSVVPLPNDEMKGRIIGREGRNIRALENATGVDLIVDDTPEAVILSGFDPVRREVARLALTKLILDGRIHPGRIEEVVNKAKQEVDATIAQEGEQACYQLGIHGIHPDLVKLVGRLKFRTSYGQNVLLNSIETAQFAAMMAAELGADVKVAKRAGLLHDIGKAVDHEVEGPHALIGADIAKRLGESPKVVHAIAAHHGEEEMQSVEAILVQAGDAISGARPGARRETLESYVKRLEALENVANSFAGVEKSFAIQAGREVRIIVKPEEIDDLSAVRLARDIVKKIEESLEYPGQIKVTVIRETRAVDYAK